MRKAMLVVFAALVLSLMFSGCVDNTGGAPMKQEIERLEAKIDQLEEKIVELEKLVEIETAEEAEEEVVDAGKPEAKPAAEAKPATGGEGKGTAGSAKGARVK